LRLFFGVVLQAVFGNKKYTEFRLKYNESMKKLLLLLLLSLGLIVNSSAEDQESSYKDTLKAEIQSLETSLKKVESQAREAEEKAKTAELIAKEAEAKAKEIVKKVASLNEEIESKKLLFSKLSSIVTVISIDKNGNYYINSLIGSGIEESEEFGAVSLNFIVSKVKARIDIYPEMEVFIRADNDAAYGKVIEVIAQLKNEGVAKVGFMLENTGKDSSTEQQKLKEQEALKVSEKEALKAKAKKVMAEVQKKAEEAKAKEAELKAKITEEEEQKKNQLEAERAAEKAAFEKEQYIRLLTQEVQAEQDLARELIIEDQRKTLEQAYINNITARVRSYWSYQGAEDDWSCEVYVQQDIDGTVQAVNVRNCNLDDSEKARAFKNSIERAIYRASPFPLAPDDAVFNREILFLFRAD
jgi:colicin import membrane protein